MRGILNCRDCIQKPGALRYNRYHDFTDISSIDLGYDDVSQICSEELKTREAAQPVRACYLVPNTLLFGTVRQYEALISQGGVEVHVSYETNELAEILGVEIAVLTPKPFA
jgi:hypothetical protein